MDILTQKRSKLLYQRGDKKTTGVVDLRCFSIEKKEARRINSGSTNRIFSEIIKTRASLPENNLSRAIAAEDAEKNKEDSDNNLNRPQNRYSGINNLQTTKTPEERNSVKANIEKVLPSKAETSFKFQPSLIIQKSFLSFVLSAIFLTSIVFLLSFVQNGIDQKGRVLGISTMAYDNMKQAGESASNSDFESTINNFDYANSNFSDAKKSIDEFGMGIAGILNELPINTPVSTAINLTVAGEDLSNAGKYVATLLKNISEIDRNNFSLEQISSLQQNINEISKNLKNANESIKGVNLNYVPQSYKEKFEILKDQLPLIGNSFENINQDMPNILKMLGSSGKSQKYLLLFQNNSEIRATGGFVGSFGIADIKDGKMTDLFIDGIFNPDGQLKEKIVPPMPIQKISANWSMHDANWFADFPTSAKKTALFYEKTGGATVDGVIAITPDVVKNLLEITGPIDMPEYNSTVDKENFLPLIQLQVEELYDKKENKPKQFLADLAPRIIEKLLDTSDLSTTEKIRRYLNLADAMEKSLKEKHILFYHRDEEIENMMLKRGWGGQILNSSGDYLSVVNSNINGYKTDAVIDEKIELKTDIMADGSITNTVKITRTHNGGKSDYDWYNRVNADYMRVYVPLGSTLLEAKGHTIEEYEPRVDYSDYKTDPDVEKIQSTMRIDPESKTQIFEEAGKTVFGNWVYVSPEEKVEVVYKYKLPYKLDFDSFTKPAEKYSIIIQKQLGSGGSEFAGSIILPINWKAIWRSVNMDQKNSEENDIFTNLETDKAYGLVFTRE